MSDMTHLLPDIAKVRVANPNEIMVVLKPRKSVEGSGIIHFNEDQDQETQFFTVVGKGELVDCVEIGDTIFMSWKDVTDPIKGILDGEPREFGFANQFNISAIIEE